MVAIYSNYPTVSHTLLEFTARAAAFYEDENYESFIRFTLTGTYVDEEWEDKQAFIDPIQNLVGIGHPLRISRDYDSAIGISNNILVDAPISVFAVPHPTYALTSSIHMTRTIHYQGVSTASSFILFGAYRYHFRRCTKSNITTSQTSSLAPLARGTTLTYFSLGFGLQSVQRNPDLTA